MNGSYKYRPDPPCRFCKDKKVGCHSKCEAYGEWKAADQKKKAQADSARHALNELCHYRQEKTERFRRDGYIKFK